MYLHIDDFIEQQIDFSSSSSLSTNALLSFPCPHEWPSFAEIES